ncbi:MAG: kdgR 2 [Bryobacterales bacterium]|nr:kdgR 2 [Bryobacterales bacterium]
MSKTSAAGRSKARVLEVPAPPEPPAADQYFSRALEKGLQALEELSQARDGLTLIEVAARLHLTKTSAFRIVRTLESLSYATRNAAGRYLLSGDSNRQMPVRSVQLMLKHGQEPLRTLVHEFRETASMAALYENHIEVVMVVESPQLVRMTNTLGRILPPHGSSMGKAIAAFLGRDKREHLLRTYGTAPITQHTITDERVIQQQLDHVRACGHAEDWEESTLGGVCFACPIIGPADAAVGAISISLPRMRLENSEHENRLIQAVSGTAATISQKLARENQ